MKLDHYSASQHGMIYRCGEQYRRRYVCGDKLPPAIIMIRGRVVHATVEANMIAKMDGGGISADEAKDMAADVFKAEATQGFVIDGPYLEAGFTPKQAEAHVYDDAIHLSAYHVEHVAPSIEPTAVEVRIEIKPSEALPVTFVSILDIIHDGRAPIDTKTKAKAPDAEDANDSEQLSGQSLAFRARYHKPEDFLRLDVLVRTPKARKITKYPLKTTRSLDDLAVFVFRANAALQLIDKEIFLPASPDAWVCNPVWCGYYDSCPYARGRKRPTS